MSQNGRAFLIMPTILLSLFLGTVIGVLLLLLFGRHVTSADTVSAINSGMPGTTIQSLPASAQTTNTVPTTSAASATSTVPATSMTSLPTATSTNASVANQTPVEGQAASGSAGASAESSGQSSQLLEQTVTDTSFKGSGAEIFVQACQSCHMPGGKGAQGAGIYPALANNPKLSAAQYPITMLLYGNGGMPSFGHYMNDQQISDVVNYVRTELNKNTDKVTPDDVKKMRQPGQHYMIFGEAAG